MFGEGAWRTLDAVVSKDVGSVHVAPEWAPDAREVVCVAKGVPVPAGHAAHPRGRRARAVRAVRTLAGRPERECVFWTELARGIVLGVDGRAERAGTAALTPARRERVLVQTSRAVAVLKRLCVVQPDAHQAVLALEKPDRPLRDRDGHGIRVRGQREEDDPDVEPVRMNRETRVVLDRAGKVHQLFECEGDINLYDGPFLLPRCELKRARNSDVWVQIRSYAWNTVSWVRQCGIACIRVFGVHISIFVQEGLYIGFRGYTQRVPEQRVKTTHVVVRSHAGMRPDIERFTTGFS